MNSRGAILIVTLWILAILIVFVTGLGFRMTLEARMTDYNVNAFRLLYIAKAAVHKFIAVLKEDEAADYDALKDDWSYNEEFFDSISLGEGSFTISYVRQRVVIGEETEERDEGWSEDTIFYGARDEAKININKVAEHAIKGNKECMNILLHLVDEREDVANAILDWIDADDIGEVTRDEGGAESDYYDGLEFPYTPKNGPLQSLEELLLVRGMTLKLFFAMKNLITIHGDGKVNLNTAEARVLEAMGISEDGIDKIITFRAGMDEEEGTSDDMVFRDVSSGVINLFDINLSNEDKTLLTNLNGPAIGLTGVTSDVFRTHITAVSRDGKIIKEVEAVVSRSDEETNTIAYWYED
jgi:general secretion pathway protein K